MLVGRNRFSSAPTRVSPAARTRPRPLQTCAPSRQSAKASMPPPMRRQYRSSSACHCRFARTEGSVAASSAHHHHLHALAPVAVAAKARDPGRNIWSPTLELLALLNGGQPSRSAAVLLYGLYTIGAPREREEGCKTGKRAGSDKVTIPVFVQYNTILFCSFPAGSDITLSGHLKDTGHAPG